MDLFCAAYNSCFSSQHVLSLSTLLERLLFRSITVGDRKNRTP